MARRLSFWNEAWPQRVCDMELRPGTRKDTVRRPQHPLWGAQGGSPYVGDHLGVEAGHQSTPSAIRTINVPLGKWHVPSHPSASVHPTEQFGGSHNAIIG